MRYPSWKATLIGATAHAVNGNCGSVGGMSNGSSVRLSHVGRLESKCSLRNSRSVVKARGQRDGAWLDGGGMGGR